MRLSAEPQGNRVPTEWAKCANPAITHPGTKKLGHPPFQLPFVYFHLYLFGADYNY